MCKNDPEIQYILSKIGDTVRFTFPKGEPPMVGVLKDRYVICTTPTKAGVKYWDVVDLIKFQDEPEDFIRIGYFRMPAGRRQPRLAGQTTITETVTQWKRILVETARKREWFRKLLEEACREMKK